MAIAFPNAIQELIQQGILRRDVQDALRPAQRFRLLASKREKWEAKVGETQTFTRRGLLPINTKARTPGQDPTPQAMPSIEQWTVTMNPYNDTMDTDLPTSFVQIQDEFLADARSLMTQAGTTISHLVRNKLYNVYLGGNTYVTATQASSTIIPVANLAGLRFVLSTEGAVKDISSTYPLTITINGTAAQVTGYTPTDATNPDGPGTITLTAAVAVTKYDAVLAANKPYIHRIGGANTSEGVTSSDKLTFADIRTEVARLRSRNVPSFAGGLFHMQLDPTSESQLFLDTEFQRLLTGVADSSEWRDFAIGQAAGVVFFRENECPSQYNTSANDYIAGDMLNSTGVEIHRPILYGNGAMMEKSVDLDQVLDEGNMGGVTKVGGWNVAQDATFAEGTMDGIKYILRGPMDRLAEKVSQSWSFKGDWACPSDSVSIGPEMFKRAVVFEHSA